jgi:hypothetical protein
MDNKFLLMKCMTLGALSFPSPVLMFLFYFGLVPSNDENRFIILILLLLSGCIVGTAAYYKDRTIVALKDWFPSKRS